jgi:hypothetical protein
MSTGNDSERGTRGKPMRKCESAGIAGVVPRVATATADQAKDRCRVSANADVDHRPPNVL